MWKEENKRLKKTKNRYQQSAIFSFIILLPLGIWMLTNCLTHFRNDMMMCTLSFLVGIFFIIAGWSEVKREFKEISYFDGGICVKYPLQNKKYFSWSAFQQVCVCYTSFTTRGERRARAVLCFVKPGAKKNAYGRWKADEVIYTGKVIVLDYTDELYEEVKTYCPYEIPDLRGKGNYRL